MVNECFRSNLFHANGGIDTYEKLWGYGLHHAIAMVNRSTWSDGRSPYHSLTQTEYKWTKDDHIFGCGVEYYVPKEHRSSKFETPAKRGIWLCRSTTTPDSHIIAPIQWDAERQEWDLFGGKVVARLRADHNSFPLKEGPVKPKHKNKNVYAS